MKTLPLTLTFLALAGVAVAQDAPMVADTDGNGTWSMEELLVSYPALTPEGFVAIDTDADGAVNAEELAAAVASGALVAG